MLRKAAVPIEEIFEAVKNTDCFTESYQLKSRFNLIWKNICHSLNNKIESLNLYLCIKQNRHNIFSRILEYKGININKEETFYSFISTTNTEIHTSIESKNSDNKSVCINSGQKCLSIVYDILIDAKTWKLIDPKVSTYKEHSKYQSTRQYSTLQLRWTDVISKLCWEKTKIPCAYVFKRAKVYDSEKYIYIKIVGKCSECYAPFSAHSMKKVESGCDMKLFVKTVDIRRIPHEKKEL